LAVTELLALAVKVQLLVLLPLLLHAPDQIASRPFDTVNVIDVPPPNDAEPLLPVVTLMPDGDEVIRSPLRPVAETVKVTFCDGGGGGGGGGEGLTVSVAVRASPS
jgi:hypothetical protein